jgi:hypothetical protein
MAGSMDKISRRVSFYARLVESLVRGLLETLCPRLVLLIILVVLSLRFLIGEWCVQGHCLDSECIGHCLCMMLSSWSY